MEKVKKATYTPFAAEGPLWWRIRVAVSLLLTPLTVVLMGRSIRVTMKGKESREKGA